MNFLDSESSFLIKFPASESTADFHYVRSNSKDSLKTLLAVLFLSLMTLGACIATYSFNILALFSSGEGLSALTNYIFALMWFVGWGLAFLFSVYLLLLSLYEQEVVVINDGILEVSHGLAFFRVGFRVRVSEVAHIDMRSIQNDFSASDKYRKFLISLNNSIKSIVVSHEFNEQKFEVLQAALVRSKARLTNIDPEPIDPPEIDYNGSGTRSGESNVLPSPENPRPQPDDETRRSIFQHRNQSRNLGRRSRWR